MKHIEMPSGKREIHENMIISSAYLIVRHQAEISFQVQEPPREHLNHSGYAEELFVLREKPVHCLAIFFKESGVVLCI